jgi:tetratricopeptide (TPR) repeat protein
MWIIKRISGAGTQDVRNHLLESGRAGLLCALRSMWRSIAVRTQSLRSISSAYQLAPQGLVFQISQDKSLVYRAEIDFVTRGLRDNTVRFEPDDVVALKVLPAYVSMLYNRGRYLAAHGVFEEAARAYKQALAFDPNSAPMRQALADSENALREAKQG